MSLFSLIWQNVTDTHIYTQHYTSMFRTWCKYVVYGIQGSNAGRLVAFAPERPEFRQWSHGGVHSVHSWVLTGPGWPLVHVLLNVCGTNKLFLPGSAHLPLKQRILSKGWDKHGSTTHTYHVAVVVPTYTAIDEGNWQASSIHISLILKGFLGQESSKDGLTPWCLLYASMHAMNK